jgi:tetratricopeptide (TPR) repeat protein
MTQGLKIFVSFSSKDEDTIRMLFSALAVQHVDVWDYSREGEKLPLAHALEESLAGKIKSCDYFLAVVSASSTNALLGRNTEFEVRSALEAGLSKRGKLLPLLLVTSPPAEWRGAYKELEGLLRVELNPSDQRQFDDAIRRICEYLSVPYVPPILNDPRVFFSRRFQQEMNSQKVTPAEYVDLMNIIIGCAEKVTQNEWEEAGRLISLFLTLSVFKVPGVQFYYPQIIRGVCELQAGHFETAERAFAQATEHPLHDENSFGGLGHAYFYQHRYSDALAAFRKALELQPSDKSIKFNIVGALLHAGASVGGVTLPDILDRMELSSEDRVKFDKMEGIALLEQGEYENAIKVFERMANRAQLDAASAIYYSRALEACGRVDEATDILRREATLQDDLNLYHHLADAYLKADMILEGLYVYEDILCRPGCCTRKYLVEYARILKAVDGLMNRMKMQEVCGRVLDPKNFDDSPPTAEDFYYMGFANYLLGNHELAHYDYQRSGRLFEYYDMFA